MRATRRCAKGAGLRILAMNLDTTTPTDIRAPEARGYGAPHGAAICGCKEGGP